MALTGYSVVDGGRGAARAPGRLSASNTRLVGDSGASPGRFAYLDEPYIDQYPGAVRVLIAWGLSMALWALVLLSYDVMLSLLSLQ